MNNEAQPSIPNDPSEIFESLEERDADRKRAIDIARQRADAAETEADREYFTQLAAIMSDVRFELHELFPEVFDD